VGGGESAQIAGVKAADFSFAKDCKLNRLREVNFGLECVDNIKVIRGFVCGSDRPARSQLGNGHGVLLVERATAERKTRWFWDRFESVIGRPAMAVDGKWPAAFSRRRRLRNSNHGLFFAEGQRMLA
jgi:hypothetical protein